MQDRGWVSPRAIRGPSAFLQRSLVTYYTKRGAVQARLLTWGPCEPEPASMST